jgi:hypothetical protein
MFGYLGSYLFDRELSKWYLGNCFMFVYGLVEQRPRQKFKTTNKQKTQNVNKCLPTVLFPKGICLESNSSTVSNLVTEAVLIYLKPSPGTIFLHFGKMDKNIIDKS